MLTLFGDYIGTLKGEGFYWVNPFCTAVNPAAGTVLSQSGDVQQRPVVQADREKDGKKIYVTEVYVDDCHLQKKATVESADIGFESEAPFGFEE